MPNHTFFADVLLDLQCFLYPFYQRIVTEIKSGLILQSRNVCDYSTYAMDPARPSCTVCLRYICKCKYNSKNYANMCDSFNSTYSINPLFGVMVDIFISSTMQLSERNNFYPIVNCIRFVI